MVALQPQQNEMMIILPMLITMMVIVMMIKLIGKVLEPEVLENLVAHFSGEHERTIQVVERSNPELIAGMRVRLGDTVYDASLANNLQSLATRIH